MRVRDFAEDPDHAGWEGPRKSTGVWLCLVIRLGRRGVLGGAFLLTNSRGQPAPSGIPETSTSTTWGGVTAAPDRAACRRSSSCRAR